MSAPIPAITQARWLTRNYLGTARVTQRVYVRKVFFQRAYAPFVMADGSRPDFGDIAGGKYNDRPWNATLTPTSDWMQVPNIQSVELSDEFDADGIQAPETAVISLLNTNSKQIAGAAGYYHMDKRGYFSPWQGFVATGRPRSAQPKNEWYDVLNGGIEVKVQQGYGLDGMTTTFVGLVDDVDVRDSPEAMTITGRSFGLMLTDQRVFGWAKARDVPSPVIFADRLKADNVEKKGYAPKASSTKGGYLPANVLKTGSDDFWLSAGHAGPNATEWIEVKVPKGRYETAYLNPRYPGMEVYCSVYARGSGNKMDGANIGTGWINTGQGNVPGTAIPILRHWRAVDAGGQAKAFLKTLELGDDSTVRFFFRNLGYSPTYNDYRASVARFYVARRTQKAEAKKERWILVDDASDIAKWVFMWCGFKEWEVENFGVRLAEPVTFHQGDYLIDIIKKLASYGGYGYHIEKPRDDYDLSMGKPVFKRVAAMKPPSGQIAELRDKDMIGNLQAKFSKAGLSYIMRTRGAEDKSGRVLGEDTSKRFMAVYYPPWSGAWHGIPAREYDQTAPGVPAPVGRLSGVYKHRVHTDPQLESVDECQMANLITAQLEAVEAFQGEVELPTNPGVQLDDQVSLVDEPSGLNTRMWVSKRHSTCTSGQEASWTQTLTGAMLDSPDMQILTMDYQRMLAKVLADSEG